jgi:N-acetyl-alpha-D-muramate 1-phosphate uridylyltransferase
MKSALLLAAGKATRLGALRDRYAKACVPVGGTTPLRQLMEQLSAAGVKRFVINLHWQAAQVRAAAAAAAQAVDAELLFLEERDC